MNDTCKELYEAHFKLAETRTADGRGANEKSASEPRAAADCAGGAVKPGEGAANPLKAAG